MGLFRVVGHPTGLKAIRFNGSGSKKHDNTINVVPVYIEDCKMGIGEVFEKGVCGEDGIILWFLHGCLVAFGYCHAGGLLLDSLTAWARYKGC